MKNQSYPAADRARAKAEAWSRNLHRRTSADAEELDDAREDGILENPAVEVLPADFCSCTKLRDANGNVRAYGTSVGGTRTVGATCECKGRYRRDDLERLDAIPAHEDVGALADAARKRAEEWSRSLWRST